MTPGSVVRCVTDCAMKPISINLYVGTPAFYCKSLVISVLEIRMKYVEFPDTVDTCILLANTGGPD